MSKMHYRVKDEEFTPAKYGSALKALDAAIKLAAEFAQSEDVDVFKVDDTGVHIVYSVDKQPRVRKGRKGYEHPGSGTE